MEICLDNQWGTVCDDSWDDNSATVVCQQLGFNSTYTHYSSNSVYTIKYQPCNVLFLQPESPAHMVREVRPNLSCWMTSNVLERNQIC